MKHIFYSILSMFIFQVTCPSQDSATGVVQHEEQQDVSLESNNLIRRNSDRSMPAYSSVGSESDDDSLNVSRGTDGLSKTDSGFNRSRMTLRNSSVDYIALERQNTFYTLDREISSFNRNMSRFRHYESDDIKAAHQKFDPEFKILCDKVRSFQMEPRSDEKESISMERMDSSLVALLLVVAARQSLSMDSIPSPISCSLSRCPNEDISRTSTAAAAAASSGQSIQETQFGVISLASGVITAEPTEKIVPFLKLDDLQAEQSKSFPPILGVKQVVSDDDSDLEDCI